MHTQMLSNLIFKTVKHIQTQREEQSPNNYKRRSYSTVTMNGTKAKIPYRGIITLHSFIQQVLTECPLSAKHCVGIQDTKIENKDKIP